MSLLDWLLIGHLVGDFLIQTDNMARCKMQGWSWMLRHIGSYMAVVGLVLVFYALTRSAPVWLVVAALLSVCVIHVVLDRRRFSGWWMRFAGISPDHPWLAVVVDQVFHLLTLAIIVHVLVLAGG